VAFSRHLAALVPLPKLDDQDRLRLILEYHDPGLSQAAFCAALEARGIEVSSAVHSVGA